jgi:hypothetical protein
LTACCCPIVMNTQAELRIVCGEDQNGTFIKHKHPDLCE